MDINKGLHLDGTYLDNPTGVFKHAKNLVLSEGKQGVENEGGFDYKDYVKYSIIGICETPNKAVLFSTDNIISEIGIFEDNVYTPVIRSFHLNFHTDRPITAKATFNYLGHIVVAWCEDTTMDANELRVLNLSELPFEVYPVGDPNEYELVNISEIEHINLFPNLTNIKVNLDTVTDGGGSLKSGVYYIAPAYKTKDGIITEFSSVSNPITIIESSISSTFNNVKGVPSGIRTNKSIILNLSNLSPLYDEFVIAVIYKQNQSLFCKITDPVEYIDTTVFFNLSDFDSLFDYDIERVLTNNAVYPKCEHLTATGDKLLISNLIGLPNINEEGQKIANQVQVKWTTVPFNYKDNVAIDTAKDPNYIFYNKHFRYSEVYALYLGLKSTKGGYLGVWHIPGRESRVGETSDIGSTPGTPAPLFTLKENINGLHIETNYVFESIGDIIIDTTLVGVEIPGSHLLFNLVEDIHGSRFIRANYPIVTKYNIDQGISGNVVDPAQISTLFRLITYNGVEYIELNYNFFYSHTLVVFSTRVGTVVGDYYSDAHQNIFVDPVQSYQMDDTSDIDGTLAYWENRQEFYPNDFPDFANQRVRHHKMPGLNKVLNDINIKTATCTIPRLTDYSGLVFGVDLTNSATNLENGVIGNYVHSGATYEKCKYTATSAHTVTYKNSFRINLIDSFVQREIVVYNSAGTILNVLLSETSTTFLTKEYSSESVYTVNLSAGDYIGAATIIRNQGKIYNVYEDFTYNIFITETNDVETDIDLALGLNITNVNIPIELKDIVDGWELFYAKRDINNSTILGQSALIRGEWYDSQLLISPGDIIKFHAFDLMFNKVNVNTASYLRTVAIIPPKSTHEEVFDYTNINLNTLDISNIINLVDGLYSKNYIPVDTITSDINNEHQEGYLRLYSELGMSIPANCIRLANLCSYKRNLYLGYNNQQLVSTGLIRGANNTIGTTLGGDTFWNRYAFRITSENKRRIIYILCESSNNADLRMDGALPEHKFYPYNPASSVLGVSTEYDNFINTDTGLGYNSDFTSVNDILKPMVSNVKHRFTDMFPNRIAISLPQRSESLNLSWREFRPNNYYDMPVGRGHIIGIYAYGRTLYIQQRYSLFLSFPKEVLATLDSNAYLREEDIFDRKPEEMVTSNNGYIGSENKFAGNICLFGYVVADVKKRAIYHVTDAPNEISSIHSQRWFNNNLLPLSVYNPFIGTGIFINYDDYHKRFILTYKGVKSFSISFDIRNLTWYSFHDYIPDYSFSTATSNYYIKNYGLNNNRIFETNNSLKRGIYLFNGFEADAVRYPFVVDVLVNPQQDMSKLVQNIYWQTVVKEEDRIVYEDTIDQIMCYNETQCTGLRNVNKAQMWYDSEYGLYANDTWYFNDISDNVVNDRLPILDTNIMPISTNVAKNLKNWFDISQFICKFVVVRLVYNNAHSRYLLVRSANATMIKDNR
jgi:hypothetical protein